MSGLETAQGLGCHCVLGQAVPVGHSPGEGGDVVAVCVVLSVARSVFCWLW